MDLGEPRVAAVFATMNRSATACGAVRALAQQTRPPQWVVVADNGSEDGTVADLQSLGDLPFELLVESLAENRGNAGGVAHAMEVAFEKGADAVWILDDDSVPRADVLEILLRVAGSGERVVAAPLQLDPAHGGLTWPLLVLPAARHDGGRERLMIDDLAEVEALAPVFEVEAAWTGILLFRSAWEEVGAVDASWFIRGEDEDYGARLSRAGYRFLLCRDAILDHRGPAKMVRWKIGGRYFFHEPGLPAWKMHYMIRNRVRRIRRDGRSVLAAAVAGLHALAVVRYDGVRKLGVWFRACREGWSG